MTSRKRRQWELPDVGSWLDLSGKVAVVTGGARGMGKGIAKALLKANSQVAIIDKTFEDPEWKEDTALIDRSYQVEEDITDERLVKSAAEEIQRKIGPVSILVNCAGVIYKDLVENTDFEQWRRVLEINTTGAAICTKVFVPRMKEQQWGRIINISSVQAYLATPTYGAYTASKAALSQLTKVWAMELAPFNITVNALCPSYVDTPMMDMAIEKLSTTKRISEDEALDELLAPIPLHRLVQPEEIGFWVVVISSDWASGLTGANLAVSCGWVMH